MIISDLLFWLLSHHNPLFLLVLIFPTVFGVNHYGPKPSKEKRMCDAGGFPTAEMMAAMSVSASHSAISGAKFDTIFGRNIITVFSVSWGVPDGPKTWF